MPLKDGTGILSGKLKVADASLARPVTERQSGRFEVISNSTEVSLKPKAS